MTRFVLAKIAGSLVTLLLAITIAFLLGRVAGDPVQQLLGEFATQEQVQEKRAELGLDKPLVAQFGEYLGGIATADLGDSLRYGRSNLELIASRLPASLQLMLAAMTIGTVAGLALGLIAALNEGGAWDRLTVSVALVGQSIPLFWLGMMLALVFAITLNWLPSGRSGSWAHLVLPAVTLSMWPMARVARLTRSSVAEVLREHYVDAARARGVGRARVIIVHVLRNASLPILTLMGLQAGTLLSGAVTIEFVFAWPGIGTLATDAVRFRDFALIQAIVVVGAAAFVLINLALDLLYGVVDPRIREGTAR